MSPTLIPFIIISCIYFISIGVIIKVKSDSDDSSTDQLVFLMILSTVLYIIAIITFETDLLYIFQ